MPANVKNGALHDFSSVRVQHRCAASVCSRTTLLDPITGGVKILTRYLEDDPAVSAWTWRG